jgi:uncharacterized protein YecE (DUF72 family)
MLEKMAERVYEALDRREAGVVTTDEPQLDGLPSFSPRLCGRDSYFRFHGRNKAAWWTGDNTSRYDYRYSVQELDEFGEAIPTIEAKAGRLFAAFNNHRKGQAVDNARELIRIINELPKSD